MRTLVINLTRLGDLLQMQPLLHNLYKQGHVIDILCLENFQEAAHLLQGIAKVHSFPSSRILALANADWHSAIALIEANFEDLLNNTDYERIINMTPSIAARILCLRLAAKGAHVDGYSLDDEGFKRPSSLWGNFFESAPHHRICSPFNIIDIFSKSICAFAPATPNTLIQPDESSIQSMRHTLMQSLTPADRDICRGFVAIQLGASVATRQWPATSFADLGKQIWEHHKLMPVLVGTQQEQALAEAYLNTGAPACNYVGQTSLKRLAHVLCCTRVLLTNDTGTMHLAAGLHIPCLAFFLATAQPWDTGPASNTSCSLEPSLSCHPCSYVTPCLHKHRCLQHIQAEHIWPLLHKWLETGIWQSHAALDAVARVWKSQHDKNGYVNLCSLSGHEGDDHTLWFRVQQHAYSQFLDSMDDSIAYTVQSINAYEHPEYSFSQAWKDIVQPPIHVAISLCQLLLDQAELLQIHPNPAIGKRFLQITQNIHTLLGQVPPLGALSLIWHSTTQYNADNIQQLAKSISQFMVLLQAIDASLNP